MILDGLFFNNLYKVIKKSSERDCDVLTCIFDILSEHYTEYMIPNKSVIHLNDLPKDDLCAITSLLMHYTCIHDRREVLTSPLCYNLQENTQVQIKKFLERIQNCTKLTNADLASIIQNCVDDTRCANWISSSVNIPCISPLHDVLQTPIKSSRLFERDKEINRLKAQIEIFQEEKESLEKDLKSQVEKSKKLEKQLSQKLLEISNLRSEVLELEDRTPPHYRDKDFREMQKILRTKVDSLEQILEQSDKENLELREERDKGKAEVIQLEGRCKVWLEKFIDTEKNLQSMTENYKEQLTKNENLQAHCLELETLLEELRPKSNNDSFIEESFQNSSCRSRGYDIQCEDLAQSVVDVQLKEIQKENDTLKIDLRELKNTCIQLKDEINKHVLEKSILSEEKRQLETELQEVNGKIEEFMLNYEQLFNQWKSITQERNVLSNEIEILQTSLEKVKEESVKLSEELIESKKDKEKYIKVQIDLGEKLDETIQSNVKLAIDLEKIMLDKCKLSDELNVLVNKNKNLEVTCSSMKFENNKLIKNVSIGEALNNELKIKNEQLSEQMQSLSAVNDSIREKLKATADDMMILKEELRIITQEHSETVSQKDSLYHNHKNVLKSLSEITKDSDKLSQMLMKCEGERDEIATAQISLKEKFTELLSKNDDLGMELKNVTAENCELSEELMSLTSKYKTLECKCENLMTEKQILNETINSMLSENNQISDKLSYITKSFESAMDDFSQENKLLTQKLIVKADVLQNVISEKEIVKGNLELIENQCLLKSKTISDHETALFKQKEVANKLHSSIIELYQKLVGTSNENKILKDTNSQLEEQCKESAKTVNDLSASLKSVIDEKEHLLKEINNIQDKLNIAVKELDTNKIEFNKIYNECQLNKEQSFNDKQKLKLDMENLILEKTKLEVALQEVLEEKKVISDFLDLNNSELRNTLHEKDRILDALELGNNEMIIMQEEKETLLKEIEKLTLVKNEFSEQLDKVSQENVDISEKLQNILKKNHSNTEQVKDLLEKVEQLTEENTQLLGRFTTLSNDLEEKSATIEILQASCNTLKMEVKEKSELLEKISEEHKDIFDIVDRLSQEKNEMKHTIDTLSEEKMQLIKNVTDLIEEKNKLIECLDLTDKELHKVKKDRDDISERYTKLIKENESNLLFAHQSAVGVKNELLKRIETAETEKEIIRTQMEHDTKNIQDSYVSVLQANSKLELEILNLRKKLEDKNQMKNEYVQIEEAYEKLLEENNRLSTDIDTIKYKRSRDRDEFVSLLKKEREEGITRENKKVKEVRLEYERKLEKMKEKMLKLYSDEVGKEIMKVKAQQSDSMCLVKTKEDFRNGLFETQQKPHMLEIKQDMLRINENHSSKSMYTSRESLRSIKDSHNSIRGSVTSLRSIGNNGKSRVDTMQAMKKVKSTSVLRNDNKECARKTATLPRAMTQIQETVTISRRTSLTNVPNIEMEDEDDDFNNKYLADLKAGHCILGDNGRESVRFSELAWRNSMLPPHLKSSYPAETQFVSPSKFREDDLKGGNVELDDSLSKLLPGEKPRQKKDFGTTTYKKPGPPTPSKNGGRLSLQGNEVQPLPLREQNEKTPKKLTPSRIRALFMGRSNIKDNSENQPVTPRTKQRLSIFRKQR